VSALWNIRLKRADTGSPLRKSRETIRFGSYLLLIIMRLIDRHILQEAAFPFLAGIIAVTTMMVGTTLFNMLNIILKNHIPFIAVLRLIVFNIPQLLVYTLPVGVTLSCAVTVSRLARESELTAMRMTGTPLWRIFFPLYLLGLAASLFSLFISEKVAPWSEREFNKTQAAILGYAIASSPELKANQVLVYQNYNIYVGSLVRDQKDKSAFKAKMVQIIVSPKSSLDFPYFITAQSAVYKEGVWTLKDVITHFQNRQGFVTLESASTSDSLDMQMPLPTINDSASGDDHIQAMTIEELSAEIASLRKVGQPTVSDEVELYFKLSMPFLCLIFSLCSAPLSMLLSRSGSFTGVFLSIIMIFVAWNTLLLAKAFGINGYIPPVISAWTVDIIFGFLGFALLRRME